MPSRSRFSAKFSGLPKLLAEKIYKTGQTHGADDDVIYQNRVLRNSTVLIPYQSWLQCRSPALPSYENGSIVLISPGDYFFAPDISRQLEGLGLEVGMNTLVSYETREDWARYNPDNRAWTPATQRKNPLGGHYVARIPATTASRGGDKISRGFTATKMKGAGIRVYEYADKATIEQCRIQLEALFWMCHDADDVAIVNGMTVDGVGARRAGNLAGCHQYGLLELVRLNQARVLDDKNHTICPLCLEKLSGQDFFRRMEQT